MPPKRRSVLCVDDDPDTHLLVLDIVREIDTALRVASALNGTEAQRFLDDAKARRNLPRLLIVSASLPAEGAKGLLTAVKADPELVDVPVVVLAASLSLVPRSWTALPGVEVLTRPINHMELYKTLKHLLSYSIA